MAVTAAASRFEGPSSTSPGINTAANEWYREVGEPPLLAAVPKAARVNTAASYGSPMQFKPTKRAALATDTAPRARYVAMCVPGRTDADAGTWYVYDREQLASVQVSGRPEALRRAKQLNAAGFN